ncbi:MAG TPA: Ku protein [Pyrinomonadaceae bacterium]|nr:Ku protein [Pyrinomonadaceae bacterium]
MTIAIRSAPRVAVSEKVMAARAIWKGQLKLGTTKVPVKLYSAVQDRTVRFHVLDDKAKKRVKQHMIDPDSGDEVPSEEIQKGYEIEPGKYVILTKEDLEALQPPPSRDIDLVEFVPQTKISEQWYERPYYAGPDGDVKEYFALVEALNNTESEGIAHWVMRNKYYAGALRAIDDYLFLFTLRDAKEVILADELTKPTGAAPTQKELTMAKQLVEMLEGEFDPKAYKDEYRNRVMEFIEKKAKGRAPRLQPVKAKRKTAALDSVLAKSIEALRRKEKRAA